MYSAVVTIREMTRMRKSLLCLKRNPGAEWDTLSKPIKAQGDRKAMRMTCPRAPASGTKAGSIVKLLLRKPSIAAAKQNVMPTVNTSTRITMMRAVASLLLMHKSPISAMAAIVTMASTR